MRHRHNCHHCKCFNASSGGHVCQQYTRAVNSPRARAWQCHALARGFAMRSRVDYAMRARMAQSTRERMVQPCTNTLLFTTSKSEILAVKRKVKVGMRSQIYNLLFSSQSFLSFQHGNIENLRASLQIIGRSERNPYFFALDKKTHAVRVVGDEASVEFFTNQKTDLLDQVKKTLITKIR